MKPAPAVMHLCWVMIVGWSVSACASTTLVVCDDVMDPLSLNPLKEFDTRSDNVVFQMFEGLVRFSDDGILEPCLATSWRRVDPLTMEFTLRKGVLFHNGETLTAQAVKFSIEKLIDPATKALCYPQVSTIARVDVVDALTVRIVTHVPDGVLLHRLPAFVKILPPKYYAGAGEEGFDRHPVGTGPFQFVHWEHGKQIALQAFDRYWESGYPKIGIVIFRFVPSEQQVAMLLKGELDMVTELPGTFTRQVMQNPQTKVVKRACLAFPAFPLCEQGPLKDVRVRKALNHAIDREALVRYLAYGNGKVMSSWSMPGELGHDEKLKPYTYDPTLARQLLKEAGQASGLIVSMLVSDQAAREARAIEAQWKKVGVKTALTVVPLTEMYQEWSRPDKRWDCFGNLCPDPMGHVAFTYGVTMFSKSPFSGFHDAAYDDLFVRMLSAVESEEHAALARKVDGYVYDQAMAVFTYQRMKIYGVRKEVECFPHSSGSLYLRSVGKKGRRS